MTHSEVEGLLSAYLEDDLSSADRQALGQHLVACRSCAETLGELRETLRLLHALPEPRAPEGFADRVIARAAQPLPTARSPWLARIALPLAAGLAGLAVLATLDWGEGIGVPAPLPSRPDVVRSPDAHAPSGTAAETPSVFSVGTPAVPRGTGLVGAADLDPPVVTSDAGMERLLADPGRFLDRLEGMDDAERERAISRLARWAGDSGRAAAVASALRATAHPLGESVARRITAPAH